MVAMRLLLLVAGAGAYLEETIAVEIPSPNAASLLQTAHRAGATIFPLSSFTESVPSKHPAVALLEEARQRAKGADDDDIDVEVESESDSDGKAEEVPEVESGGETGASQAVSDSNTADDAISTKASEADSSSGSPPVATVEPIADAEGSGQLKSQQAANQTTGALAALDKSIEAASSVTSQKQGAAAQAAGEVAAQLSIQSSKEEEAEEMERKAAELRTKAAKLTQAMTKEARKAGEDAASAKMEEVTKTLSEMYEKARQAEIHSVVLQTSAKLLLNEANDFTAAAGHVLHGDTHTEPASSIKTSTQ